MKGNRWIVLGLALLAALAVWWALGRLDAPIDSPAADSPPHADTPDAEAPTHGNLGTAAPGATAPDREDAERRIVLAGTPTGTATLRGRCVAADGAPLRDCTVTLRAFGGTQETRDQWLREHGELPEWLPLEPITTGDDGRFAFAFVPPPTFQFDLAIAHDRCISLRGRWPHLDERANIDLGDVALQTGVRVTGRIVDTEGAAVAGLAIEVAHAPTPTDATMVPSHVGYGTSGDDGAFVLDSALVPGEFGVRVAMPLASPTLVTLPADGADTELRVVVRRPGAETTITGRIFDDTGAPAAGVLVMANPKTTAWAQAGSGRDGRFVLQRAAADDSAMAPLQLTSRDHDILDAAPREVAWGARDVVFQVGRAGTLTLRVTDEQGAPVEFYMVRLAPEADAARSGSSLDVRVSGHHDDGLTTIPGLSRGTWRLIVEFPAASGLLPRNERLEHPQGGARRLDLVAKPVVRRMLRLVTASGAPIAGAHAEVCYLPADADDFTWITGRPRLWWLGKTPQNAVALFDGDTDADGRLELRGPGGCALGLDLPGPGHVPQRRTDLRLDEPGELVVQVAVGAVLRARIVPPEAIAGLKRRAGLEPDQPFPQGRLPTLEAQPVRDPGQSTANGKAVSVSMAADGTFAARGLAPGVWHVGLLFRAVPGAGFGHPDVTLAEGQVLDVDFDLTAHIPGTLVGRVVVNGAPHAQGIVTLRAGSNIIDVRTDDDGGFTCVCPPGDYELSAQVYRDQRVQILPCRTRARIVRDQTATGTFAIDATALQAIARGEDGRPVAGLEITAFGGVGSPAKLPLTNADGTANAMIAPGTYALRILPKAIVTLDIEGQRAFWKAAAEHGESDPLARHWLTLATVPLVAGEQRTVVLQVPASAGY